VKKSGWSEQFRERIAASDTGQRVWARYETASPREQQIVRYGGSVLGVVLLVALVILPLHDFHSGARADFRAQADTLAWMQANRAQVGAGAAVAARPAGESLLALANSSARNAGVTFQRSEPGAQGALNVWLEKVAFNQVVVWLAQLERDYGIVATEFSASRRNEPGLVDVRVTLLD
jgi:general secretion pathway protein M